MPRITEIRLYPIKSCAGINVESAKLEPRGFARDRRYMLVDARGRFLTQREHSQMARIRVETSGRGWRVTAAGQRALELPETVPSRGERRVRIWGEELGLSSPGAEFDEWFSRALGLPCHLVQMSERHERPVRAGRGRPGDLVSLADGAPVLLTSDASLAALNARLPAPVPMSRFRPNLVAAVGHAFAEDRWRRIRTGEAELEVAWACTRCVVTTIDPETGEKDAGGEPLKTLKRFRTSRDGVMFGQNLIPRRPGTVRVGDRIEILEDIGE